MFIPQGDWIVVMRKVRHEAHQRGTIAKAGLTEKQARQWAITHKLPGYDCWAMHKNSY